MKSPEQFSPEEQKKRDEENAKEVVESLKDTPAGKYMEGEPMPGEDKLKEEIRSEEEILKQELRDLEKEYACGIDAEPRWCVFGWGTTKDAYGVLYWIKPGEDDKETAGKMAELISRLGGKAEAKMTEWNEDIEGEPIYELEDIPDKMWEE